MNRILIADDEPRQLRGLAGIVQGLRPNIKILTARNGQEALNLTRQNTPDAVLTDIRMPVLDGLDFCDTIQKEFPQIVVALVSAYEEFEYAARALRIGAVEYLIKPYSIEQVEATLRSIEQQVERRRRYDMSNRQMGLAIDAWRQSQLVALLTRETTEEEVDSLNEFLAVNQSGLLLWIQRSRTDYTASDPAQQQDELEEIKQLVQNVFPHAGICILPEESQPLIVIVPNGRSMDNIETLLNMLLRDTEKVMQDKVLLCRSGLMQTIKGNARQALEELRFLSDFSFYEYGSRVLVYDEFSSAHNRELPSLHNYDKQLQQCILAPDDKNLNRTIIELLEELNERRTLVPEIFLRGMEQLGRSAVCSIENRISSKEQGEVKERLDLVFSDTRSYGSFCERFTAFMQYLYKLMRQEQDDSNHEFGQNIVNYIQNNANLPLTLSQLSEKFYFSPNYLSTLIKQYTNMPFKQYLLSVRLRMAIDLLVSTDEQVAIIARNSGFSDAGHFNRVFKKEYGVSPNTFRRREKSRRVGDVK